MSKDCFGRRTRHVCGGLGAWVKSKPSVESNIVGLKRLRAGCSATLLAHRTIHGPALDLVIDNQYYVGINYPLDQGTQRVHASWLTMEMSTGDASTGAANQLIDNWKNDAEELDAWIAENL